MNPPRATLSPARSEPRIEVGSTVAGLLPHELVERFGSPLYIYDGDVIRRRVGLLRSALPPALDIAFATKANPSPAVLALLASAGLGADVASGGELRAVLRAGFEPGRIVFTGPGKTDAELLAALRAGVGALTIESLDELESVMALAPEAGNGQGLLLRLVADAQVEERPIIHGHGSSKFGLTDEEAGEAVRLLLAGGSLQPGGPFRLRGFHAFGASNVREAALLVDGVAELARRAEAIAGRHGLALELLDAGGGLGITYADDEAELDLAALGEGLAAELGTWATRPGLAAARLLLEPGRWLTGPAGAYLCRVVRTKQRGGRHVAVMDGGIHHLLRPRLVGQDHRIVAVGAAARRGSDARLDVVGPLCTGLDVLATDVAGPAPRSGDLLAVLDAGAYGYSESMPFFLSHPIPAEILAEGGSVTVSRQRVEPA